MKKNKESFVKFLTDFLPLIVFFGVFKTSDAQNPLIDATIYLVGATIIAVIISYILTKKVAKVALFSAAILGFFGGLTILLKDDIFIKLKPTIINLLFAIILFVGHYYKKPFLSYLLGEKIRMSVKAWLTLSFRWAIYFVVLAILNEIIWRNFSTDFWVQFKVFGMLPISFIFTFSQLPFMIKEMKKFDGKVY